VPPIYLYFTTEITEATEKVFNEYPSVCSVPSVVIFIWKLPPEYLSSENLSAVKPEQRNPQNQRRQN
jgi:hypothetical protein